MDFFDGFLWAVPTVFSDAIAKCKFEEGDILYNSQTAYLKWDQVRLKLLFSINVKYPRRTLRVTKGDMASVASANWNSEVRVELRDLSVNKPVRMITTTQGALFSLLWKGGVKRLHGEPPSHPLFLKDLTETKQKRLYETENNCTIRAKGKPYFIMAFDPTNEVSKKKHRDVLSILEDRFGCDCIQLNPKTSGYLDWEEIFPVILTNLYVIDDGSYDEITDALRGVLYKPSPKSKSDGFKIHRHGILRANMK